MASPQNPVHRGRIQGIRQVSRRVHRWYLIGLVVFGINGCGNAPEDGNHQGEVVLNTGRLQYSPGDTLTFTFTNGLEQDITMDACQDATIYAFELWRENSWETFYTVNDECPVERLILRIVPPQQEFTESFPLVRLKTSITGSFRIVLPYMQGDSIDVAHSNTFQIVP